MYVKCKILKKVYSNGDFRVLSCKPLHKEDVPFVHPIYGTFSLSGDNLTALEVKKSYVLDVFSANDPQHPDRAYMIGSADMQYKDGRVVITAYDEITILKQFMTKSQAVALNKAYPHFVQEVLDGKTEADFDVSTIHNVKNVRIKKYVESINENKRMVMLTPCMVKYGITSKGDMKRCADRYRFENELVEDMKADPYYVYIDVLGHDFKYADKMVLKLFHHLSDSTIRCQAACKSILKEEQGEGHTRMTANSLAKRVYMIAPECYDKCVEAVKSQSFYYDQNSGFVSLMSVYKAETNIVNNLLYRATNPQKTPMNNDGIGKILTSEQHELLDLAINESVMMLVGSAGSGKSFATKSLVEMLEANNKSFELLAPTGTAAKVLSRYTGYRASTIHMFLTMQGDIVCQSDYVIIDEASMVGVELMSLLLDVCDKHTKIVMICDDAQLASISCGNMVTDILNSGIVKTARLTKIFRYNTSGLITIATDVRNGSCGSLQSNYDDYKYIEIDNEPIHQICEQYERLREKYDKEDILILSPYNKGNAGTRLINKIIQDKYNDKPYTQVYSKKKFGDEVYEIHYKIGDIVLNTKNDYGTSIYDSDKTTFVSNGSRGVIVADNTEDDHIELIVDIDGTWVIYDNDNIANLTLGYAESCHKAQGGSAKAVIVVISQEHESLLSRNILYVACTRSQEELVLISEASTINKAVKVEEQKIRNTWLYDKLTLDKMTDL